jgi:hypothetical protein
MTGLVMNGSRESETRWRSVGHESWNDGDCGHWSWSDVCRDDESGTDTGRSLEILRWRTDDVGDEKERTGDRDDESGRDVGRGRASRAEVGRVSVC